MMAPRGAEVLERDVELRQADRILRGAQVRARGRLEVAGELEVASETFRCRLGAVQRHDGSRHGLVATRELGPQLQLVGGVAHQRMTEPHRARTIRLDQAGPLQGAKGARYRGGLQGRVRAELHEHTLDQVQRELATDDRGDLSQARARIRSRRAAPAADPRAWPEAPRWMHRCASSYRSRP